MRRVTARVMLLSAAFAMAGASVAPVRAQPAPPATPPAAGQQGGQAAGSQAEERSKGAVGGWLWPILGLAVVGGLVAAGAGGGGGGGGGVTTSPATTR